MRYEGRVFRPPSEAYSLIVQATIGCSHNKCAFCEMYKEKKFRIRNSRDVLGDLNIARATYRRVDRIFLADGDAMMIPMPRLMEIVLHIKKLFPECERVGIYASPTSLKIKTVEELRQLKEAGIGIAYLGLESGNEEVLARMDKGSTVAEIVECGKKVKEAGIALSVTAISGLGGKEHWQEHAVDTAKALSEMKPEYIGLLTLMVHEDTPLYDWVQEGSFTPLDPREIA
ncbi:MAG: radical SAM protein, partial [Oscillospiraceae bacterium]|nr:radical SAM protein [Oscillospiraceae bacterium]